jgi:hydrogenase nickel incorporation protein HypA/HybF
MHELSIAEALVAIAEEHAGLRRVARVEVKVGALRQVVPGALAFAFELVARGTVVEGAELALEQVPVRAECRRCGAHALLERFPFACPVCDGTRLEIVDGEQLSVEALEVLTEEPAYEEAR